MESRDSIIRRSVLEAVVPRLREELSIIKRLEKYKIFRELELVELYIPSSSDRDLLQIVYNLNLTLAPLEHSLT